MIRVYQCSKVFEIKRNDENCQNHSKTHVLQKNGDIRFLHVRSSDNLADLFNKTLQPATSKKLFHLIGLCHFEDLDVCTYTRGEVITCYTLFPLTMVFPIGFSW